MFPTLDDDLSSVGTQFAFENLSKNFAYNKLRDSAGGGQAAAATACSSPTDVNNELGSLFDWQGTRPQELQSDADIIEVVHKTIFIL